MSQKTLFNVKCTNCGQPTSVPFKPSPNRPVYCKTCFSNRTIPSETTTSDTYNFEPKQAWARLRK